MNLQKTLVVLIALVVYINYENYFKVDTQKLYRKISNIKANIGREQKLRDQNYTKESFLIDYEKITFNAKKYNYSQAMGEMQNEINDAAKDLCKVQYIRWGKEPTKQEWYDKLRMSVSLTCKPKAIYKITNQLKEQNTLFVIENFRVFKNRNKDALTINFQLIAFRTKDAS